MILEAGATYWGLSDTVEVVAWVENDEGKDLYPIVDTIKFELMHTDTVMLSITAGAEHYSKDLDEEKGSFRAFFLHPPIQYHQYILVVVNTTDGQTAKTKINVLTEKMLKRRGNELTNPDFGGRGAIVYSLPIEKEQA